MSNLVMYSLVISMVLPFAVAFINRERWSSQTKVFVFVFISILVAAGTAFFQGDLTGKRWFESFLIIFVAAGSVYRTLKPVGVDAVEKATG